MHVFINGVSVIGIENGEYLITDREWECYKKVTRKEFIEELKNLSWVCLTSWSKELREQYLKLVDYCNKLEN